jgi:hypothetical protein
VTPPNFVAQSALRPPESQGELRLPRNFDLIPVFKNLPASLVYVCTVESGVVFGALPVPPIVLHVVDPAVIGYQNMLPRNAHQQILGQQTVEIAALDKSGRPVEVNDVSAGHYQSGFSRHLAAGPLLPGGLATPLPGAGLGHSAGKIFAATIAKEIAGVIVAFAPGANGLAGRPYLLGIQDRKTARLAEFFICVVFDVAHPALHLLLLPPYLG